MVSVTGQNLLDFYISGRRDATPPSPGTVGFPWTRPTRPQPVPPVRGAGGVGRNYQAVSPERLYMGAFQFSQGNMELRGAGRRPQQSGRRPANQATRRSKTPSRSLSTHSDGDRPWLATACS